MAANNNEAASFVLDDRSVEARLDVFRQYSQLLPFGPGPAHKGWPAEINWAQVILGYEAGACDPSTHASPLAGERVWEALRTRLSNLYNSPEQADGLLPPEQAFLLTLIGLLETPQALLNQLPARHRTLYYQNMLALKPRSARADQLTASFMLSEGAHQEVLPAGLVLDAGQDSAGGSLRYALSQPLSVNAARVTDLRWVVRDACVPGGRRARTVFDEEAGIPWPAEGVRLFEASPPAPGKPLTLNTDRAVRYGRIVESSLLAIPGGLRTWTVTLDAEPTGILHAAISIDDNWVELPVTATAKKQELMLTLAADGGVPEAVKTLDGLTSASPLLRLLSEKGVAVPGVTHLAVSVREATGVLCADDEGNALQDGGLPFGTVPESGCSVNLMSPDWWRLGDRMKQITVTPTWAGLPNVTFAKWYGPDATQTEDGWLYLDENLNVTTDTKKGKKVKDVKEFTTPLAKNVINAGAVSDLIKKDPGYTDRPQYNTNFTVQPTIVRPGGQASLSTTPLSLFSGEDAPVGQPLVMALTGVPSAVPGVRAPDSDDPGKWPWRVRLTLGRNFLQQAYEAHVNAPEQMLTLISEVSTVQMVPEMELAADGKSQVTKMVESKNKGPDNKPIMMPSMVASTTVTDTPVLVIVPKAQWKEPYLPQWSGVEVSYTAEEATPTQRVTTPFGFAPEEESLPSADAELYMGIDGIEQGQLLSLHWQLKSPQTLPVEWQYLAPGERWARLPVNDETDAFREGGNWSAEWPGDASSLATSMPAGRMWLRGRVLRLPVRDALQVALPVTPWLTGLITNAGTAVLMNPQEVQPDHFITGLPAQSVTQALNSPPSLQGVLQPWPSSGGIPPETHDIYEARVARRLRHRDRALNDLDLMTLLREQYPAIRELAVMAPQRSTSDGTLTQTLVVMPEAGLSDSDDVQRPALSPSHLQAMSDGLLEFASPWLHLECINPTYVPVRVGWEISYAPGMSRSAVDARVKVALEQTFMPWSALPENDDGAVVIGRKLTHMLVRDVLRRVPGVKSIGTIYLNDSGTVEPDLDPGSVAVLTCVPTEYTGLTLSLLNGVNCWGSLTFDNNSKTPAAVRVTVPKTVTGLGPGAMKTDDADVWLVDLDTGQRLTDQTSLKITKIKTPEAVSGDYTGPLGTATSDGTVTTLLYGISCAEGLCGVYHLGVALGLKVNGKPDVTLLSAAAGQRITLHVRASGE